VSVLGHVRVLVVLAFPQQSGYAGSVCRQVGDRNAAKLVFFCSFICALMLFDCMRLDK
jgi:hypothetical protein